jgi:carbon-monoxide dehydrogenase large subunit
VRRGHVVDREAASEKLLPLAELGRVAYYRSDTLPAGLHARS